MRRSPSAHSKIQHTKTSQHLEGRVMPLAAARTRVLPRIACHTTGAKLLSAPREGPDWSRAVSDVDRQMVAMIGAFPSGTQQAKGLCPDFVHHPKSANYWYF